MVGQLLLLFMVWLIVTNRYTQYIEYATTDGNSGNSGDTGFFKSDTMSAPGADTANSQNTSNNNPSSALPTSDRQAKAQGWSNIFKGMGNVGFGESLGVGGNSPKM